jgi:flagellar hook-associated protein 2
MAVGTTSLDVNSLVSQLVSSERSVYATRLTARETKATVQLSAISTLKGALSSLKTAVDAVKTASALSPRTTTSSDQDAVTATASGSAATGSYSLEIIDLAQAHQLASGAFVDGADAEVGTGTLTFTYGTTTFEVEITEDNNTLDGIRDAINDATGNTGVQATLLNEQGGTRLVLTSAKTGADNTIKVAQSGGDGGLAALVYDGVTPSDMTQVAAAKDAHIKIATFDHYSDTNTVTDAIDDVTLTLKAKTEVNEPVTVSIAEDTATLKTRIKSFVDAYNAFESNMDKLRNYNAGTKSAGPLLGDALLRGIEREIGLDLSNPVGSLEGDFTTLASIGITKQVDGQLKLDETKLNEALEADRASVSKIFTSEDGVAVKLSDHLDAMLKDGSALDTRNDSLQKDLDTIEKDTEALDARMAIVEARYRKQFTALDALLTQLQTTSSYLTAQLASINNNN